MKGLCHPSGDLHILHWCLSSVGLVPLVPNLLLDGVASGCVHILQGALPESSKNNLCAFYRGWVGCAGEDHGVCWKNMSVVRGGGWGRNAESKDGDRSRTHSTRISLVRIASKERVTHFRGSCGVGSQGTSRDWNLLSCSVEAGVERAASAAPLCLLLQWRVSLASLVFLPSHLPALLPHSEDTHHPK